MTRSKVKSLTILLLPISFVVGCGIGCLRVYFWVSNAHSRVISISYIVVVVLLKQVALFIYPVSVSIVCWLVLYKCC